MLIRIITGIIGILLAGFVIQSGGMIFAGFALALSFLTWFEYTRAFQERGMELTLITGFLGLALLWYAGQHGTSEELLLSCSLIVLVVMLETVLLHGSTTFMDAVTSLAGIFYIGLPFTYMTMLRNMHPETEFFTPIGTFDFGCAFIWIMFIGTWASDTFAYFTGSAIGKHKLCSTISPKKTIEGFFGAVIGTTLVVSGIGYLLELPLDIMAYLGLAIAILATLGDLVESVAKRYTRIKDSGSLIPGHGGVWDRFDSVLFTAPLVYYFVKLVELAAK